MTKILRESYPDLQHEFDLWHIVKGIHKKLLSSKQPTLVPWVRSIGNHLWYCASTCNGNADKLKEKWISLLNHITNRHQWMTGEYITECEHEAYSTEKSAETAWLKPNSSGFEKLQKTVLDKKLLKDLCKVSL